MSKSDVTAAEVGELPPQQVLGAGAQDMFEQPVEDDHFDTKYIATRWEIWSYYLYYAGNTSISGVYTSSSHLPSFPIRASHSNRA